MTWKLNRTAAKSRAEKPRAVRGSIRIGENCGALTGNDCFDSVELKGMLERNSNRASLHRVIVALSNIYTESKGIAVRCRLVECSLQTYM